MEPRIPSEIPDPIGFRIGSPYASAPRHPRFASEAERPLEHVG